MATLFERVVSASGLSSMLGPGAIRRACERAGVSAPESMNRFDLLRALPEIEHILATYLSPDEAKEHATAILQLTRSSSGLIEMRLDDERLDED